MKLVPLTNRLLPFAHFPQLLVLSHSLLFLRLHARMSQVVGNSFWARAMVRLLCLALSMVTLPLVFFLKISLAQLCICLVSNQHDGGCAPEYLGAGIMQHRWRGRQPCIFCLAFSNPL